MKNIIVLIISFLVISGCISVNLPKSKSSPSKHINASSPRNPFKSISAQGFDQAWISETSGSTIAYVSECNPTADLSADQIFNDFVGHITGVKTTTTPIQIAERAGIKGEATGSLDGVPVQLSVVVFKKDGCDFILSHSGVSDKLISESAHFNEFIQNFKVNK